MKTQELLDKYQKLISGRLNCNPKEISFYKDNRLVGELDYYKTKEEARDYAKENNIPFNMEDHVFIKTDWGLGVFEVKVLDKTISTFKLYQLPHCCAIAVSCNAKVFTQFQNNRIGTLLNSFRQDLCRVLGYSSLMCTDIEQNINQRKLLATNGWKDIYNVINKRTNNRVYISIINI